MKLSFSNIAWKPEYDEEMYSFLQELCFTGLEIAPTRIIQSNPYDRLDEAQAFANMLKSRYGLLISSMQSILYGRNENIFVSEHECNSLFEYTKKAVNFAVSISCNNIVFGCPKNRKMPKGANINIAYDFFRKISDYAQERSTTISLEANPLIYGTNFINRTEEAFLFVKKVKGLAVNIDLGTVIENMEDLRIIADNIELVNHVHISEPNLTQIKKRNLHSDLFVILKNRGYSKHISVEMNDPGDIEIVKQTADYVRRIFT